MRQIFSAISLVLILAGICCAGVDKSGVKPSVLSLPSGPGSIEGLGESFEPQLNSGTATYPVKLKVPPGRAGFAPDITLSYNSGAGNGAFGLGWKLDIPYIQRQTDKGLPYYSDGPDGEDNDHDGQTDESDESDRVIYADGEELVPVGGGIFRCENESSFVKFSRTETVGWTATAKDGVVSEFGITAAARIENNSRVFKWLLEKMTDTKGNRIDFVYKKMDDTAQQYCTEIQYNDSMRIVFDYEKRPDIICDYRPRFELKTAYRCTAIRMFAGEESVRSYTLTYETTDDVQPLSLLKSLTQIGSDGTSSLPPAEFGYVKFEGKNAKPVNMPTAPQIAIGGNIDLIDLNADGLPDILDTNDVGGHDYYPNLGPDTAGTVKWSGKTEITTPKLMYLKSDTTQLADMNGDGQTDMLDLSGTDSMYYKSKKSSSGISWELSGYINDADFDFRNSDTRLIDLNNDKLIDVMRTDSSVASVWLNLKEGRWSKAFTPEFSFTTLQFTQPKVRLADMNGDRLQDLLWLENDACAYYPGMGFGEFGAAVTMENPPFGIITENNLLTADVNGDGLSDMLYVPVPGDVKVWLNLGLDSENHSKGRFANPFSVPEPLTNSTTTFRQCDMNGNGSTDILWNTPASGSETFAYLDFAPGEQPYQLKSITNGIGKTITISYSSSVQDMIRDRDAGSPWPQVIPFPVSVVAKVEVNDGQNTYTTEFYYHDGYYDGEEKEFRGFAKAEKREIGDASAPNLKTKYRYETGVQVNALKGKPLLVEALTEKDEMFFQEVYTWMTLKLMSGAGGDSRNVTFPYQQAKTLNILEKGKGTPVQLKWEYVYDNYGNIIKQTEYGRTDEGWDDERITETSFTSAYDAGKSNWMLDKPVEIRITDESGVLAAKKRNYYDGNTELGKVSKGNLTRTEDWVQGDSYIVSVRNDYDEYGNVIASYDPLYPASGWHKRELVYDLVYHSFPVQETIYTGNADVATLTMTAEYDYGFGVMTSSTDFNGYTTTYAYDTFGRITSVTKPPDTNHTVEYDYVLAHSLGNGKLINWIETRQRDGSSDGFLRSRSFHDGLGRKIMTRSEGENPGQIVVTDTLQFNARQQPWKTYLPYFETGTLDFTQPTFNTGFTEHFYDAMGREIRANQPVETDGAAVYSTTTYQPLVKIIQDEEQTHPNSPHYGYGMRYVEDGLQDKDGKGRLRKVYEIVRLNDAGESLSSPAEWLTSYEYDLSDNLTRITDSKNNQKMMQYDGLGRKTFMNDPDRGKMYYTYDDAGNLIKSTDAKGQVILYAYDGVNRLTAEYYGEEKPSPDVKYYYDLPSGPVSQGHLWQSGGPAKTIADMILSDNNTGYPAPDDNSFDVSDVVKAARSSQQDNLVTAENTKGFLSYVQDQSGYEHNSYDERGRVKWVIKRIGEQNFCTGMTYDSMDRVISLTYPDQSSIAYTYNSRGLLESVPNVIGQYDYNPAGQNALLKLACGTETAYQYDHRLRLNRLKTLRSSDNLMLQDIGYAFDGVSNITGINDGRDNSALDKIGSELGILSDEARKFNATQSFVYDSLYRLTQAANSAVYGMIKYRYDKIGNMVRKDATLLQADSLMDLGGMTCGGSLGTSGRVGRNKGDSPGPHAITGAEKGPEGAMTFTYDDNGNMTSDNGMSLSWDFRDRLTGISKGAMKADYVYDYSDTRKKKTVSDAEGSASEAVYVDKYSEIREGRLVKYVYAGNSRAARIEDGKKYFYLHDHLGSTSFTLSDKGAVTEQLVNYPYGNPRVEKKAGAGLSLADYKFTGKERDIESGLQYFEARYLCSHIGRFITLDFLITFNSNKHILIPQTFNPYQYGSNNPIRYIDPDGNLSEENTKKFAEQMKSYTANYKQVPKEKYLDVEQPEYLDCIGSIGKTFYDLNKKQGGFKSKVGENWSNIMNGKPYENSNGGVSILYNRVVTEGNVYGLSEITDRKNIKKGDLIIAKNLTHIEFITDVKFDNSGNVSVKTIGTSSKYNKIVERDWFNPDSGWWSQAFEGAKYLRVNEGI
jgi:RHS repeat-associated protein